MLNKKNAKELYKNLIKLNIPSGLLKVVQKLPFDLLNQIVHLIMTNKEDKDLLEKIEDFLQTYCQLSQNNMSQEEIKIVYNNLEDKVTTLSFGLLDLNQKNKTNILATLDVLDKFLKKAKQDHITTHSLSTTNEEVSIPPYFGNKKLKFTNIDQPLYPFGKQLKLEENKLENPQSSDREIRTQPVTEEKLLNNNQVLIIGNQELLSTSLSSIQLKFIPSLSYKNNNNELSQKISK